MTLREARGIVAERLIENVLARSEQLLRVAVCIAAGVM
jgi:hypothetical protein